jgi:hypothetical protein
MWLISIVVSILIDVLALKPIKVFVTWVAGASIVDEEVRAFVGIFRKRSSGSAQTAYNLIQHYNPACRVASKFSHLWISQQLKSLNDDDIKYNSKSTSWRRIKKNLLYWFCFIVPTCPLFIQDSLNELFFTSMFGGIVLFGVYGSSTPAYTQYFTQYYVPCVCTMASLVLLRMIFSKCVGDKISSITEEDVDLTNIHIDVDNTNTVNSSFFVARDKLILTKLYNFAGGPHWAKKKNWLSLNLQEWEGVISDGENVSSLDLSKFFISGVLIYFYIFSLYFSQATFQRK